MFKIGAKYHDDGVWHEYETGEFLIRPINNMDFKKSKFKREQPYRRKIEAGTLPPEQAQRLAAKSIADALLVDWKKVQDEDENPVSYTKELATKALILNEEFAVWVIDQATVLTNYALEEEEETVKKSPKPVRGIKNTATG